MKNSYISINHLLDISEDTTFDIFKKSSLYSGQVDNRFFWLADFCELGNLMEKFKVGFCFRNNKIVRMELFCVENQLGNENERKKKDQTIIDKINENYDLKFKSIESSFDQRNNYNSIIIVF